MTGSVVFFVLSPFQFCVMIILIRIMMLIIVIVIVIRILLLILIIIIVMLLMIIIEFASKNQKGRRDIIMFVCFYSLIIVGHFYIFFS